MNNIDPSPACWTRGRMLLSVVLVWGLLRTLAAGTPLDDYVNAPDPHYEYRDLGKPFRGADYTTHFLNMTSQKWLNGSVSSRSVWWHYLAVTIPDQILHPEHAFLYITGGSNTDGVPSVNDRDVSLSLMMAVGTKSVCATLFQIPNQPVTFVQDPLKKTRTEDAIIAFTWWYFLRHTNQPDYLLRLPMTKAAVRALDTIADFATKQQPGGSKIDKFVVAGASKRGWTTWTVGAVDKRVVGIIPIVMDLLNISPNLHHFWQSLGGWTFAFKDYYEMNLTTQLDSGAFSAMHQVVDPYVYIDRLTMPKLMICTGGDEFFQPDDSIFYWDQLKEPKFIRTLPNAEHSCAGHFSSIFFDAYAFYSTILLDAPFPEVFWTITRGADGGSITLHTKTPPSDVRMWHATTLDGRRRDFRLITGPEPTPHPVLWFEGKVEKVDNYTFVASQPVPEVGWTAFFIQVALPAPNSLSFEVTTQVNIIPPDYPFPDCHGQGCKGTLL